MKNHFLISDEEKNRIRNLHESYKNDFGTGKVIKEQDERNELQQDVSLLADHLKDWTSWVTQSDLEEVDTIIRKYLDSNRICVLWDAYLLLDTDGLLDQIDEIGEKTSSDTAIELKNSLIESLEDANCEGTNLTEWVPFTPDMVVPSATRIKDKFIRKGSQIWDSMKEYAFGADEVADPESLKEQKWIKKEAQKQKFKDGEWGPIKRALGLLKPNELTRILKGCNIPISPKCKGKNILQDKDCLPQHILKTKMRCLAKAVK